MSKPNLEQYSIKNSNGIVVKFMNYGATITEINVPDKLGLFENIVLSYQNPEDYFNTDNPYLGSTIGRFANRIANGRFNLNGFTYHIPANNFGHCLHGGNRGFDKVMWQIFQKSSNSLVASYLSPDGEEGFPGNLKVELELKLSDDNTLSLNYKAITDKSTPINLTNHSYFNLSAGKSKDILSHFLQINASELLQIDEFKIPTGKILTIKDSAFDFSKSKIIGEDIDQTLGGYDHNYILKGIGDASFPDAELYDSQSGRVLQVFTSAPGLQFYSGNYLNKSFKDKRGNNFNKHEGLCLEPQHFPDSPNQPKFPNTILHQGEVYSQTSKYKFLVRH
jgi:aldose 1-epimerase